MSSETSSSSHRITFDKAIRIRDSHLTSNGVGVRSESAIFSTLRTLIIYVASLADSHTAHVTPGVGATHVVTDSANGIPPNQYPGSSLESLISSLNYIKTAFNAHVSSGGYHMSKSLGPGIVHPDATDFESCVSLSQAVTRAIREHAADGTAHSSLGQEIDLAKSYDGVVFIFRCAKDGSEYVCDLKGTFSARVSSVVRMEIAASHSQKFTGWAPPPYLASVVPELGLKTRYPSGVASLGPDLLHFFFSRPMGATPVVASTQIVVTGASGMSVSDPQWVSPREMVAEVRGMEASQYSVVVMGIPDAFGNLVAL